MLCRLVQQYAETFIARAEDTACADLPQVNEAEFDAFLTCGSVAYGFLWLLCGANLGLQQVGQRRRRVGGCVYRLLCLPQGP